MEQLTFNFDQPAPENKQTDEGLKELKAVLQNDNAFNYLRNAILAIESELEDQENAIEKQLNKKISRFYDETYTDEIDEAISYLKSTFEDYDTFDEDTRKNLVADYLAAQHKVSIQRENKKFQKVKRVPPAPPGIDEIAHMIGEDKLASFLSVKRAKPLWPTVKDGLRTVLSRPKEIAPIEYKPIPTTSPMTTVAKLEKLIGDLTTQELVVQRKLVLARKALFSATEKLVDMPIEELLELENVLSDEKEIQQAIGSKVKELQNESDRIIDTCERYLENKKNYIETDPDILKRLAEKKEKISQGRRFYRTDGGSTLAELNKMASYDIEKPLEPLPQIEYGQD